MHGKIELLERLTDDELSRVAFGVLDTVPSSRSRLLQELGASNARDTQFYGILRELEPERRRDLGFDVLRVDALELARALRDEDIRGLIFELPRESLRPDQPLFHHQDDAVSSLERNGGASGIIHLPTGAGKTRIGIEIAARRLSANPNERIIWASYPTVLINQGMSRLAELAGLFPPGTRIQWCESRHDESDLLMRAHITFMLRECFTKILHVAADPEKQGALRTVNSRRRSSSRVTVIYDECHQLGATKLQKKWRGCEKKFGSTVPRWRDRFQTIGLSATPLPTDIESRAFLEETIFPIGDRTSVKPDWRMLVHSSVTNKELVDLNVLCKVNREFQRKGTFDIPEKLIARVRKSLGTTGKTAAERDEFTKRFNAKVMSHPDALGFLAERLGANLRDLGKTLVFVATIDAANRLAQLLKKDPRVGPGLVTLVHSRLDEFVDDEDDDEPKRGGADLTDEHGPAEEFAEVMRQINAFIDRKDEPCIMINVGMLTTGFDDPKIRTVVLARLTQSVNLFWQMIGRGLRGPELKGTVDCNVVDPIRLTERFSFARGYWPSLAGEEDAGAVEHRARMGGLDPRVPEVCRAPVLAREPRISPDLRKDIAVALGAFLQSGRLDASLLRSVVVQTSVTADGTLANEFVASSLPAPPGTSADSSGGLLFEHTIRVLENELRTRSPSRTVDLTWLRAMVPSVLSDVRVESFAQDVEFVRHYGIVAEEEYHLKKTTIYRDAMARA